MVGKALGVKTELQQITGANRIPFLLTDKVDVVISVMGLTPERAKQISFTAPYANTFLAVYGAKSAAVDSAEKLGSLRIAAAKGTTQELAITAMNPRATIMRTEDDATRGGRLPFGPGRFDRDEQHRGAGACEAEPGQGVRPEVRHPSFAGAHGRADGRT